MDNHQDIIDLIKSTPAIEPPGDFTPRVMARLPVLDQGIWSNIRHTLLKPVADRSNSRWARTLSASNTRECSFYFFITGFFYLIIGIVLLTGFRGVSSTMAAMDWIRLQPHLTLLIAAWLLILGIVLLREGKNTIKLIRFGTLFYVFFIVFNGVLMRPNLHVPYAGIFVACFIGANVFIGFMLFIAVQRIESTPTI